MPALLDPRRVHRRLIHLAVTIAAAGLGDPAAAGEPPVQVLVTPNKLYQAAADALVTRLRDRGIDARLTVIEQDSPDEYLDRLREQRPRVIVTAGAGLTQRVLRAVPRTPVVFLMTTNTADAEFLQAGSPHHDRVAGVPADCDPADIARLLQASCARCGRLALLMSERSRNTAAAIKRAAARHGVTIDLISADRDRFPEAIEALNKGHYDGVVMIPDACVYNAANVRRLLLWGLRRKKAVWAFSEKVIRAGAYAGTYVAPEDVGNTAAGLVEQAVAHAAFSNPGVCYVPARRAVNVRTASMIGLQREAGSLAAAVTRIQP